MWWQGSEALGGARADAVVARGARSITEDAIGAEGAAVIVVDGSGCDPCRVIDAFFAALDGPGSLADALLAGGAAIDEGTGEPFDFAGAATAVAIYLEPPRAWVAHVGDCRATLVRGPDVRALTRDHRLIEDLIAAGHLTRAEAASSPHKNVITRALGIGQRPTVDVQEVAVAPGDRLVLTTDGVHDRVDDLARDADALVHAAFAAGGTDDATAVVVTVVPSTAG